MSWQMPITGQWNPGAIAQTPAMMTPDMQAGNYTQEQWALMQQQNWQQWTQWQQQYAQWQSQYGDKYAQQMQAIQQIGGMPPLPPTNAPPPAPPPPDKPPPPPHENDQPLYANSQGQPVPVPAPTSMQTRTLAAIPTSAASQPLYPAAPNSYENNIGNNQQWSYESESHSQPPKSEHQQPPPPPPSQPLAQVNADALKKLAEEERLFDIQFKKWEEEIEKWKSENVNHPDKQAYNEYEQKFEACRAQLLERRKQMNLRRAKLLGTPPQVSSVTINKPPVLPMNIPMTQAPSTTNQHQGNLNKSNHQQQNYYNNSPQYLNQNAAQNQSTYGRANNQNAETQDRYGSYQEMSNEDTCNSNDSPSFLPSSASSKGIPGLDLVSEADKTHTSQQDVIDITEDEKGQKGPDYNTISKGINNILGDAKIMNILSMVIGKSEPTNAQALQGQGNQNNSENSQWGDNTNYQAFRNQQQQFVNQQNRGPNNMNHPMQNNQRPGHPMQRNQGQGYPMQQNQGPMQWNQRPGHPNQQNQGPRHPIQQNQGPGQPNQQNQGPGQPNQQNQGVGQPHQGPNRQMQQGFSQQGPPRNMFNNRQSGQEQQDQYYNDGNGAYEQDYQNHGHTISEAQRPGRPNRPLIPNLPGLQQINEFPNTPNNRPYQRENVASVPVAPPPKPKWVEEPLFAPSIIVEYEHKPLRLKARDFLEPVHLFDYNHISKDDEYKSKDSDNFGKEFEDELFTKRGSRRDDDIFNRRSRQSLDRHGREREPPSRDYERRFREDLRDDWKSRAPPRDSLDERRRPDERYDDKRSDDRYDDRRRDDRDRYSRRDSDRDRDREREKERDDRYRRDDSRNRGRESESRKRGTSTEDDNVEAKKAKGKITVSDAKHVVMIDDLIEQPGRDMRPEKLVIILRGPPGSGKSYLAKLIRDREAEYGNAARIMSIDDYFMQEIEVEEKDPATGKIVKKPSIKYEYDEKLEETYLNSLKRAFKRSLTDGYFPFLIYDAVNDQLKSYADVWNFARQNGFQVYICTMEMDAQTCYKRNIHNRTLEDIEVICARFFQTPSHHIQLDATTLLQNAAITEVHMEDADDDVIMEDQEPEVESSFTSKWEKMDDANQLARLDGTSKPLRSSQLSMEDYLQLDEWQPSKAKPGKKTVRWADIEERREQEKMRAIGFVVGQTDWNRMTDPTMGSSALTQTKYIERVRRK